MLRSRILLLLCILVWQSASARADEVLTPAQAAAKVGEVVTVEMEVKAARYTTGGVVLHSEADIKQADALLIRLPTKVVMKFGDVKTLNAATINKLFDHQVIRVSGKVQLAGKTPIIEVQDPGQIEIVGGGELRKVGEEVQKLYKAGTLFERSAYKEVRATFSRQFEAAHAADLRKAYGDDFAALNAWLAANSEVKENFYTALDERGDNIPKALGLFKEIWKRYPATLPKWNQLAIATALTWDDERGIYDYANHQTRVESSMPGGMMDALENYKYVVDNEARMPQAVALYPWEFLVFVVNHRTPLAERNWAFQFFQSVKGKKSWHQEVPYDIEMYKNKDDKNSTAKPRLAGKDYTLANILTYGGVCAHQADFASRTAQSLGIPAVYCSGASAYREHHAWWMFVNVASATKAEIKFLLQSDGRFDGKDNFFTGQVLDPQSGKKMLDRDMERRLWVAGNDRLGKRLAALIMRIYPSLKATASLNTKDKVDYLDRCIKVSKYNEDAWLELALMAKRGELKDENKKIALDHLASLNIIFANYPDFIWRVFDNLVAVATDDEKIKKCEQVIQQFQKGKRADLVCDARLKLTKMQVAQGKHAAAFTGLTATVRQFPTEGRYVPKLLKKMGEVAPEVKGGPTQVAQMYVELIPNMVIYYKSASDVYFKTMRAQATAFFAANNLTQYEATLDARIAQAKVAAKLK